MALREPNVIRVGDYVRVKNRALADITRSTIGVVVGGQGSFLQGHSFYVRFNANNDRMRIYQTELEPITDPAEIAAVKLVQGI